MMLWSYIGQLLNEVKKWIEAPLKTPSNNTTKSERSQTEPNMFKNIYINLTGPICTCDEEKLSWFITYVEVSEGLQASLGFQCQECKTRHIVGPGLFKARFVFDKPYPGRQTKPPPKTNVVQLSVVPKEDEEVKEDEPTVPT